MNTQTRARTQSGLSLIEVLVGMTIGLIGIVLINQSQVVFENYKRSTAGSGEAQVNGALALFSIERDVKQAGAGVAHSSAFNCGFVRWHYGGTYSNPPTASPLETLYMRPVFIVQTAGQPDKIFVMASSSQDRMLPATLNQGTSEFMSDLAVDNQFGFAAGDLVIVQNASTCQLTQVIADPTTTGNRLRHNNSTGSPYNPAAGGGTFTGASSGALIFNLGNAPILRTYEISSNSLVMRDALAMAAGGAAQTIVNDIVDLKAMYGLDDGSGGGTASDGIVDQFTTTAPSTAAGWAQVLALRVAVLARSQNFERPDPPGSACTATTTAPAWTGGTLTPAEALPSCYKYRVFETVIPLRNMIWRTL